MKFTTVLLAAIFLYCSGFGQNRISDHNDIGWYTLTLAPKINNKWSGHFEYQWRRNDLITQWQQSLLRTGITYKLSPQISLQAGYAWIVTYPYSQNFIAGVRKTFPEHRLYEQLVATSYIGKAKLTNRLRLEQRWNGRFNSMSSEKPDEFVYLNRLRFMPRIDVPLGKSAWYVAIYDEIFIGFGNNVWQNVFDQNRFGVMAGNTISKNIRIEGGYLSQILQLGRQVESNNIFQYNNGIIINGYVTL